MSLRRVISVAVGLVGVVLVVPGARGAEIQVVNDPLNQSTIGVQQGGSWATGGGWQAAAGSNVRITYDAGTAYCAGRFEVDVRNYHPCTQPNNEKCHIMTMYESTDQTRDSATAAGEAYYIFRTGTNYFPPTAADCHYKVLSHATGPQASHEARIDHNVSWNLSTTYHYVMTWEANGLITVSRDGNVIYDHNHGTPFFLRYLLIGRDQTGKPNYGEQPGVIYSNVQLFVDTDCQLCTGTCDDGDPCTVGDQCSGMSCVGTPMVCDTPPTTCHEAVGTCVAGACEYAELPTGTSCANDNLCTQNDLCQEGVCVDGDAVVCPAPDECHDVGWCDPASGQCSQTSPILPDGTPCTGGACVGGVCTAGVDAGVGVDAGTDVDGADGSADPSASGQVIGGCNCRQPVGGGGSGLVPLMLVFLLLWRQRWP